MKSENRVIDDENDWKPHFWNSPWTIIKKDVHIDPQHNQDFLIAFNELSNGFSTINRLLYGFLKISAFERCLIAVKTSFSDNLNEKSGEWAFFQTHHQSVNP
jgi:hypothetical protein